MATPLVALSWWGSKEWVSLRDGGESNDLQISDPLLSPGMSQTGQETVPAEEAVGGKDKGRGTGKYPTIDFLFPHGGMVLSMFKSMIAKE